MATFTRRGRFEIIHDILSVCRKRVKKTRILYKCNLSFEMMEKYLGFLISQGLLEETNSLRITKKGKKFLIEYEHLKSLFL